MSMSSAREKFLARMVERHNRGEDILQIQGKSLKFADISRQVCHNTYMRQLAINSLKTSEDTVVQNGIMFCGDGRMFFLGVTQ